tara:strand:+ start:304 stop:621 length:318 start_codon:yes stop_codon:yes gene_type:complete
MSQANKVIIYPTEYDCENNELVEGSAITIVRPTKEGLEAHDNDAVDFAEKYIPELHPFFVLLENELPEDRQWEEAWTADFSEPHGHGLGPAMYEIRKRKQESEEQ